MNLLQLYKQKQFSELFNQADKKGVITINGYSFDIRLVHSELYCNSLPIEDFLDEAMLSVDERLEYEESIYEWLLNYRAA